MASAFLCGPTVFRRTEHVCHTCSIAAHGRGVHTQPCRFTQGENVVNILLASHIYILFTLGRRKHGDVEGMEQHILHSWPLNVMKGVAHYFHGNPASVIFDFDQQPGSDEISSPLQVTGRNLTYIVFIQLLWQLGLVLMLVIIESCLCDQNITVT